MEKFPHGRFPPPASRDNGEEPEENSDTDIGSVVGTKLPESVPGAALCSPQAINVRMKWLYKKKKQRNYLQAQFTSNIPHFPSFQAPITPKNMNICFLNNRNQPTATELYRVVPSANLTTLWHKALQVPTTLDIGINDHILFREKTDQHGTARNEN